MRRMCVLMVIAMTAMMMVVGAGSAVAGAHNQKSCEEAGGTWENNRGEKTCTFETVEDGKNDKFECTTTDTDKGQGNLGNKSSSESTEESTSDVPGSGKCPPGQFK